MEPEELLSRPTAPKNEPPLRLWMMEGRAVAETIIFALDQHIQEFHREARHKIDALKSLRKLVREHEDRYHREPSLDAAAVEAIVRRVLDERSKAESFQERLAGVDGLARAVARAVELGIRIHRESSPVHRQEEAGEGAIAELVNRILDERERAKRAEPVRAGSSEWWTLHAN